MGAKLAFTEKKVGKRGWKAIKKAHLTANQLKVIELLKERNNGPISNKEIAEKFGYRFYKEPINAVLSRFGLPYRIWYTSPPQEPTDLSEYLISYYKVYVIDLSVRKKRS